MEIVHEKNQEEIKDTLRGQLQTRFLEGLTTMSPGGFLGIIIKRFLTLQKNMALRSLL